MNSTSDKGSISALSAHIVLKRSHINTKSADINKFSKMKQSDIFTEGASGFTRSRSIPCALTCGIGCADYCAEKATHCDPPQEE